MTEHDDPLDASAELGAEQQPVGADRVRARCATRCSARRAAASRPARPGRARAVRRRRRRPRPCAGRVAGRGRVALGVPGRHSRMDVLSGHPDPPIQQVVRVPAASDEGPGGSGISGSSNWQLRWIGPSGSQAASRASVGGLGQVDEAGRVAEQPDLVGRLVGAGAAEPGGAVGGERRRGVRRHGPPRGPPDAGWPPRYPRWSPPPPAGASPWPGRARGTRPCARRSACAA